MTTPPRPRAFRLFRDASGLALALAVTACASAPPPAAANPPPPAVPATTVPPPKVEIDARGALRREDFSTLFTRPRPIDFAFPPPSGSPPPATCSAFVHRQPEPGVSCHADGRELAAALEDRADAAKTDRRLAALEAYHEGAAFPPGFIRALRAELAPTACGDALVTPLLAKPTGIPPALQHALFGLGIAARLARASDGLPTLAPPYDKARVAAFVHGPVEQWLHTAATSVEENATWAARLEGYGRGVAATEAGIADLRLVDQMRSVPIPDELSKDAELRRIYESKLDEQLEPRMARGRDAALVGLRDFADVGALVDPRGDRARALLAKMYAGRRIDALDALVVPGDTKQDARAAAAPADRAHLYAVLPTFYAGVLRAADGSAHAPITPGDLRALLTMGFPADVRAELSKADATTDASLRVLEAEGRLLLARRYWRAVDVDEALRLAGSWTGASSATPEQLFIGALAQALRGGPLDAAQMMLRPPQNGLHLGDRTALDALGASASPNHGAAQLDSALLTQVTAPPDAGADFFRTLGQRYRAAGAALDQDGFAAAAAVARARAEESESVAKSAATPAAPPK